MTDPNDDLSTVNTSATFKMSEIKLSDVELRLDPAQTFMLSTATSANTIRMPNNGHWQAAQASTWQQNPFTGNPQPLAATFAFQKLAYRQEQTVVDVVQHCSVCRGYVQTRYLGETTEVRREQVERTPTFKQYFGTVDVKPFELRDVEYPVDEYRCDSGHLFRVPIEPARAPMKPAPVV